MVGLPGWTPGIVVRYGGPRIGVRGDNGYGGVAGMDARHGVPTVLWPGVFGDRARHRAGKD